MWFISLPHFIVQVNEKCILKIFTPSFIIDHNILSDLEYSIRNKNAYFYTTKVHSGCANSTTCIKLSATNGIQITVGHPFLVNMYFARLKTTLLK